MYVEYAIVMCVAREKQVVAKGARRRVYICFASSKPTVKRKIIKMVVKKKIKEQKNSHAIARAKQTQIVHAQLRDCVCQQVSVLFL